MEFAFTEEQSQITQAAREMLLDVCKPTDLRRLLTQESGFDTGRWQTVRDMGLLGILAPESAGGMGLGLVDLIGIAEAAGYVALPEPLVELSGIAVPLLASLDGGSERLSRVLEGGIVAIGHPVNPVVEHADVADCFLIADEDALHLLDRKDVSIERQPSFDSLRRLFRVQWSVEHSRRTPGKSAQIALRGAILAAAQQIGLAQRCIDMSVAYAKERIQFGKPIGSYQAVKHLLATAQVKVEFARPVVHAAAAEFTIGNQTSHARIAHAKIAAGVAADLAARTAVQVHGAMGITWEVDLHFFLKRALALNFAWGAPTIHRQAVLERIQAEATGPDTTFSSESAFAQAG